MTDDARWSDSMPEVYDRCLGPSLFAPFAARVAAKAATLDPQSVLELAAGTGVATSALASALPRARIEATDLNPAMVSWAAERVPDVQWRQADAEHLGVPDASVDLIVCQFGAMFFPDKVAAYTEAVRAMTPDGTLLLTVWDTIETSDFPRALVESLETTFPDNPPTFVARVPHGYTDEQRIADDLRGGGFAQIEIERLVLQGVAPSAAVLAEGFCKGTPLRFALEERGPLESLTSSVAEEMTARLGQGEVTGALAGFLVSARRPRQ